MVNFFNRDFIEDDFDDSDYPDGYTQRPEGQQGSSSERAEPVRPVVQRKSSDRNIAQKVNVDRPQRVVEGGLSKKKSSLFGRSKFRDKLTTTVTRHEEQQPVPTTQTPDVLLEDTSTTNDAAAEPTVIEVQATSSDEQHEPGQAKATARRTPLMSFPQRNDQQTNPETSVDQPSETSDVQVNNDNTQIQAHFAPLPAPTQEQQEAGQRRRTRTDGKKTLTVVIDEQLHARLKNAAKSYDVPVKRMVVMMIENCFPES